MVNFKLNYPAPYAQKLLDGINTGEFHHIEKSQEYLAWLAEGNKPLPPDEPETTE